MFGFGKKRSAPGGLNDLVRKVLSEHGDDGSAPRHVVHYAYPSKEFAQQSRSAVREELENLGFAVRDASQDGGVIFEHHVPVASASFDQLTDQFEVWFRERGWGYDGWEAALDAGPD